MKESFWVQFVKTLLLALSAYGYTFPLLQGWAHLVAVIAVILASLVASLFARWKIRTIWCVSVSVIFLIIGLVGNYLTLDVWGVSSVASTIQTSRILYFTGIVFGLVFLTRSLSLRYRTMQIIESALIIGTLVYVFFAHRDFNLQNPREFADTLYSNGLDPITIYRYMGIGSAFLSLPMLFGKPNPGRAIYSLIALVIIALLAAFLLEDARLPINVKDPLGLMNDDNDEQNSGDEDQDSDDQNDSNGDSDSDSDDNENSEGSSSDDKNDNKNGGGGGNGDSNAPNPNSPPTPVAIAVFYDEFTPGDGIFHFRQSVQSQYDGNHLVASTYDDDVISSLSSTEALEATPVQAPEFHTKVSTSMFLMKEHAQPPQLAMGQKVYPIQNPDPKLFVSSYAVESLGFTLDISRLIGHHSIPAEWSSEKVAHYLEIPDDPRYRALSDIIVRQIDPRFIGDDMVKAMYIKSWLEKNGYYTMKTKHIDKNDPTASFLFGSLRGYCVHFAHSAVYLLRSQGIAARVAIGYAIDNRLRGTGSAVLILGNQAHAWPEIYVDGVGWVTLEIFPENGDEPPREFADQDLESLFGELARDDKSGGRAEVPIDSPFEIPWKVIWFSLLGLLILALIACYTRKIVIIMLGKACNQPNQIYRALRAAIFQWSMYGHNWRKYISLHEFAEKEAGSESATYQLVELGDAAKLGAKLTDSDAQKARLLLKDARREAAHHSSFWRKLLGIINPIVRI